MFGPFLDPTSQVATPIHLAAGSKGAYELYTAEIQLQTGSWLTAREKQLLEEAHNLIAGEMAAHSLSAETPHHVPKRASADAQVLGVLLDMLLAGKFSDPSSAV